MNSHASTAYLENATALSVLVDAIRTGQNAGDIPSSLGQLTRNHKPQVFISYRSLDHELVTKIYNILFGYGTLSLWFDQGDIKSGDVIAERIRSGVLWAEHFVIFIPGPGESSEWTIVELWDAWQKVQKSGGKLIPVAFDGREIPGWIKDRKAIRSSDPLEIARSIEASILGVTN